MKNKLATAIFIAIFALAGSPAALAADDQPRPCADDCTADKGNGGRKPAIVPDPSNDVSADTKLQKMRVTEDEFRRETLRYLNLILIELRRIR